MLNIDDYILGNGPLHERFCASTEILAKLISSAPRAVSLKQIEECTGRPAAELEPLCTELERAGLLRRPDRQQDSWMLACRAADATLEDVFRSAIGVRTEPARSAARESAHAEVELLMMQVTMAINQSVLRHLRQFPLDRLKSRANAWPVVSGASQRSPARGLRYPDASDYGLARAGF